MGLQTHESWSGVGGVETWAEVDDGAAEGSLGLRLQLGGRLDVHLAVLFVRKELYLTSQSYEFPLWGMIYLFGNDLLLY